MISTSTSWLRRKVHSMAAASCGALSLVLCASGLRGEEPLQVELVSEVASIQPGAPFYVGLHLKHKEHFHTYWRFPGIVGVPTDMAWKLPPGWKAGPIEWPAPERVMMFQIKAQGYYGEVMLPMKLTPPKDLEPGTKVTLGGKATWMCCGTECNPDFADLSVTLPVDKLPAPINGRWQKQFAKARADQPIALEGYKATAARGDGKVVLRIVPEEKGVSGDAANRAALTVDSAKPNVFKRLFAGGQSRSAPASAAHGSAAPVPGIFFTDDGYVNADKEQVFRVEDDALVIEMAVSKYFTEQPPAELRGILWLRDGSLGKGAIIRAPFDK